MDDNEKTSGGKIALLTSRKSNAARAFEEADEPFRIPLLRKGTGELKDCRENVYLILLHHPVLQGLIALDRFANDLRKTRAAPWGGKAGDLWTEQDGFSLGLWIAQNFAGCTIKARQSIDDAVLQVGALHSVHPVVDWLESLEWDGVPRLDYWLADCLGARQREYIALVGRYWIISMVARVCDPGCLMRAVPVFEGEQYTGKSAVLRALVGREWFSDTPFVVGDKDSYQGLRGKWLYEIAELDAFSRAEATRIKAFISSASDNYRPSFGRRNQDFERQCIFVGTTNQYEYLKDPSGGTRFWPIDTGDIDVQKVAELRDQLFAEAVVAYKDGERRHPTAEQQRDIFTPEQEQREIVDPWMEMVERFLSTRRHSVTLENVLVDGLKVDASKIDGARMMATRIGIIMHRMGWIKRRYPPGQGRGYYYDPPGAADSKNERETPF